MSGEIVIWHNPRCSKSRATLALLEARGVVPAVRLYLEDAPSQAEIRAALAALGADGPRQLMRSCEPVYRERRLGDVEDADVLVAAMAADPVLIERPLVIAGGRAAIGRPPEAVLALLEGECAPGPQ
ncbi:arsenate reductase (glutaredoxin) [Stappia sp.]|uniref:arsenate reductase (glutaredoxin) n=1 Tax=Stappia sp. TaxID=1870903 RepID=UPI003A9A1566